MTDYAAYCSYVHRGMWEPTRFHKYLCYTVQGFLEENTGHALDIMIISTPPQHGKLIADNTPVLTSEGWKKHGDLAVGDYVYNHKGEKVQITYIHPKHFADREVTLTNGEKICCHHNHEWLVYDKSLHKERVVETSYMENRISYGNQEKKRGHRYNFMLPNRAPIEGEEKPLEVEPYVLGVWLGDGTNTKQCICASPIDKIVLEECSKHYPVSSTNIHKDTGVLTWYYAGLNKDLRKYGMCFNVRTEKHIPTEYLTASHRQRLELLAGLIDTDGYVDHKHNRICFTTADPLLRETFIDLISTFGWRTAVYETQPRLSSSGIQGRRPYWQICFNPTEYIPCRIERKKLTTFSKQRRISIMDIKEIPPVQGNCITVEGGIYCVGKKMVPTHNSITITETLPSWYLGRNPTHRVIEISYNEDFAQKFGRRNRQKIKEFGEIFGIETAKNPDSNTEFELSNNIGGMISRGVLSGVTGNPANLMIIDDPFKTREEADSETTRDKIYDEWLNSFRSRLAPGAKVILIMTRWHEDDLAGRLIKNEKNVRVINLPLEAEDNDPLGRNIGDALCPEIGKDNKWLADFKSVYLTKEGSRAWNALYQGHPTGLEGNMFKREWWRYYDELPDIVDWVMSVDAAFKDGDDNDFVAIQVWGKCEASIYLVDAVKKHLNLPDTMREIIRLRSTYPLCKTTLIEDKANGSAIINMLRKDMTGIIAVEPKGGKVSRANAIVGAIESGNVYLPHNKPFVGDFIEECAAFPNGAHDDQCFVAGTKVATLFGNKSIEDIMVGDRVITPFGIRKVTDCGCTGEKEVIEFCGVRGTPDHKFVANGKFVEMDSLTQDLNCDKMQLREVIEWRYRKLLLSMELNTDLWGRGNITFLSQLPMKAEKVRKDFMLRFGNFITEKKFLKAMKFTIKTVILLITTLATLSVFHASNILKNIAKNLWHIAPAKSNLGILNKSEGLLKNGTVRKRAKNGIKSIMQKVSGKLSRKSTLANAVEENSCLEELKSDSARIIATKSGETKINPHTKCGNALCAERNLKLKYHTATKIEPPKPVAESVVANINGNERKKEKVYNITVEKDHLFYAGGFLVSNCDAMTQALNRLIYNSSEPRKKKVIDPIKKYFPNYGRNDKKKYGRGANINVV